MSKLLLNITKVALFTLACAAPGAALNAQDGATASKPIRVRIVRTGKDKTPDALNWTATVENTNYGSESLRAFAKQSAVEYKKTTLGLNPKDPKFEETPCPTPIVVDADPTAPFGHIHTILEAFVVARFRNFEFTNPAGNFKYTVPMLDEVKKVERLECLKVSLNWVDGIGIVRGVGVKKLKDTKTEDEQVNEGDVAWKKYTPPAGSQKVATFYISSSILPWKDVAALWGRLVQKGITEIELALPDNSLYIPEPPKPAK